MSGDLDSLVAQASKQYAEGWSLADVASEFGVHARTLAREFRRGIVIRPRRGLGLLKPPESSLSPTALDARWAGMWLGDLAEMVLATDWVALLGRLLQVYEAVRELLLDQRADGCSDVVDSAGTAGEAGRKRYQHPCVMSTRIEALCGDPSEVRHILGEHHVPLRRRGGQDVGIGPAGEALFGNGGSLDTIGA